MPKIRMLDLDFDADDVYQDEMDGALRERGPWTVDIFDQIGGDRVKVVLQSDDFTHDVALEISGDFRNVKQKVRYAHMLAARMNKMPAD